MEKEQALREKQTNWNQKNKTYIPANITDPVLKELVEHASKLVPKETVDLLVEQYEKIETDNVDLSSIDQITNATDVKSLVVGPTYMYSGSKL